MEIPGPTLITVQSSINSQQPVDGPPAGSANLSMCHGQITVGAESTSTRPVTPLVFANPSALQSEQCSVSLDGKHRRSKITCANTQSLESRMLEEIVEMDETDIAGTPSGGSGESQLEISSDSSEQLNKEESQDQDEHIVVINSPTHLPYAMREHGGGLHSVSTTLVVDEEHRVDSFEDEVSTALEWFRSTFSEIGNSGRISLAVFKQAAMECDVNISIENLELHIFVLITIFSGICRALVQIV